MGFVETGVGRNSRGFEFWLLINVSAHRQEGPVSTPTITLVHPKQLSFLHRIHYHPLPFEKMVFSGNISFAGHSWCN